MFNNQNRSGYGVRIHRLKTLHSVLFCLVIVILVVFSSLFLMNWKKREGNTRKDLLQLWESGNFADAYALSKSELRNKPMDYFLLTVHGFSAYQLGISQINNFDTLAFIDEVIWSLRKAMLVKKSDAGEVYYVLGKAYYYKGTGYADLAIKYLEMARGLSYNARDIPEYLGLAYAAVKDYRSSIAAFTIALNPVQANLAEDPGGARPSDALLLAIARSYMALEEPDSARAYLSRCIESSKDSASRLQARLLYGEILKLAGDWEGAEAQYQALLGEAGDNAEAYYQLGELYAGRGETTRARAEWRRAVHTNPAHAKARSRLNM
jgi:tetratricopeptide (TPR) repeat protein